MIKSICALCAVLTIPIVTYGQQQAKTLSEHDIVTQLASRDFIQMSEAMGTLRVSEQHIGFSPWMIANGYEVSAPIRAALINALEYHLLQYGARSNEKPYDEPYMYNIPDGWGADLCVLIIALRDETAIPALLKATGYGWGPIKALLDFGPMIVSPAIECAENDSGWWQSAGGCITLLSTAVYLWRDQLSDSEMERLHALTRMRLSRPIPIFIEEDYLPSMSAVSRTYRTTDLALALGWTEEFRALAHARLKEIDPEEFSWQRELILDHLSGKPSPSLGNLVRSANQ